MIRAQAPMLPKWRMELPVCATQELDFQIGLIVGVALAIRRVGRVIGVWIIISAEAVLLLVEL